jgi:hypothetical protein
LPIHDDLVLVAIGYVLGHLALLIALAGTIARVVRFERVLEPLLFAAGIASTLAVACIYWLEAWPTV